MSKCYVGATGNGKTNTDQNSIVSIQSVVLVLNMDGSI